MIGKAALDWLAFGQLRFPYDRVNEWFGRFSTEGVIVNVSSGWGSVRSSGQVDLAIADRESGP
jgi:hypothetical protein